MHGSRPYEPDALTTGSSSLRISSGPAASRCSSPIWTIRSRVWVARGLTQPASGFRSRSWRCAESSPGDLGMRALHLPSLHTVQGKYIVGALIAALSAALYLLPNHWQAWPASYLPMTALDKAIPFWPQTGWAYAAAYGLLLITFILARDLSQASRFLYACLFAQVFAAACFVLWPTVYPRELYPTAGIAISDFWR